MPRLPNKARPCEREGTNISAAEHPWVDGLTMPQALDRTAARYPDQDALRFPKLDYGRSYGAFRAEVRQVARALLALGIRRGDHIGIWATNWPQWVLIQFASAHVGAVLVNVNPAYRAQELAYVLRQADITALFLTDRSKNSNFFDILLEVAPELSRMAAGELEPAACPRLRHVVSIHSEKGPGMLSWAEFLHNADGVSETALDSRQAECLPDDVVNIQYTSGTTGFPKGAMLSHRNLLMNAFYVGQRMAFTEHDRLCIPVPFYHCFGCVMGTLMCSLYGAAMVVPSESFDALATLQTIQDERCTGVYGVPTMFITELAHPRFGEFSLKSLRTGIMAGSPCPIEVMRGVIERMGASGMTIAYGLTEASPIITQTQPTDALEQRVGTVGTALPGLEVRIAAADGAPLPPGEPGELWVRGHGVMKGYYNKPAETAQAITPDGWLRSGDLAVRTPEGYFRITGRIKDMIIRGGENIYPREIEDFLHGHPAILDVQVVGLPDERFGEEVSAWIRVKPGAALTEDEVKAYCRDRIAHFKTPRYVVFVDEYPTTVTGKVQKIKLREIGIERFGLQKAATLATA
jgi:fatty-acyl-CoA synthase